jgi:hypothetical protein
MVRCHGYPAAVSVHATAAEHSTSPEGKANPSLDFSEIFPIIRHMRSGHSSYTGRFLFSCCFVTREIICADPAVAVK